MTYAPSTPSALSILKLEQESKLLISSTSLNQPGALIQVGPWAYPLYVGQTAILKNELGVYVVPNPTNESPSKLICNFFENNIKNSDMFVGIILPRDLDPKLEEEFIYVLNQFSVVKCSEIVHGMSAEQRKRTSERMAQFLVKS